MKKIFLFLILSLIKIQLYGQTTVFLDNFNTSQGSTFTTNGYIGSTNWTVIRSGDDWGARIYNGILELTNDTGTTINFDGWVFVYQNTSSFSSPFNPILSSNTQNINYILNMRQIRDNPAGFGIGNYGVALIIGSTGNSRTTGNGYAIVLGQTGTIDPIRFIKFNNGLGGTLTNLITASIPLNDVGNEYLSLALKYYPATNTWELYGRNDGFFTFGNPSDGNLSFLGSAADNTYTGTSLTYFGAYWQGSISAEQTAYFDNFSVVLGDVPLPVQLNSFNYILVNNSVQLIWSTATEVNNYGFEIEKQKVNPKNKAIDESAWKTIGLVHGNGNSNSLKTYSFIDKDITNGKIIYRLKQIDFDGKYEYSKILEVDVKLFADDIKLTAYPNPFNPVTKIRYFIPESYSGSKVTLKLFDVLGREIKTLVDEINSSGKHEIEFNGKELTSGIYFFKLEVNYNKLVYKSIIQK